MSRELSFKQRRRLDEFLEIEKYLNQRLRDIDCGQLRHNQLYVRASEIAEQYYCEKKVEMEHLHGRVETETKRQGSEGHESLNAESVEIERTEVLEEIFSGGSVIVHELPLLAEYRGVVLAGQPDAVIFNGGLPVVIFEVKFSNSPYPYRSYHAQARVYGRILDGAGFDTSDLYYVLVVAPRDSRGDMKLFTKVVEAVNENGSCEASLEVGGAHIYINEYHKPTAERDIDWALDYWRGSRDAAPVDNPAKCRNCEFKDKCFNRLKTTSNGYEPQNRFFL
jgi:CRISPR/Cas system-associated exonuclease Cas4 (RecB family)